MAVRPPSDPAWQRIVSWLDLEADIAPTGQPTEFLPFCALQAMGAAYTSADDERRSVVVDRLRRAAGDARWRIRESVTIAFQRMAETDFDGVAAIFESWIANASLVELRAIVASLAHPPLLRVQEHVRYALNCGDRALETVAGANREQLRSEEYHILTKGLGFALSLFVAAQPVEGFALVNRWADRDNPAVRGVLKTNLAQPRLSTPNKTVA